MSEFDVTVVRSAWREHVFRVEADTETEAEDKALDEAYNYDWHDSPEWMSNYELRGAEPVLTEDDDDECA